MTKRDSAPPDREKDLIEQALRDAAPVEGHPLAPGSMTTPESDAEPSPYEPSPD